MTLRNIPPRYPPPTWNMNETTLQDGSRTNNLCESWNNAFLQLVGHKHPSIWTCVEALQKDNMLSSLALQNHDIGIPLAKRVKRKTINLQGRLKTLCEQHQREERDMESLLRAVGHTIRYI